MQANLSVLALVAGLSAAGPATAITYAFDVSLAEPGQPEQSTADVSFSYTLGDGPNGGVTDFPSFALDAFSVTFTGGIFDGMSFGPSDTIAELRQDGRFGRQRASVRFFNSDGASALSLNFDSTFTDVDVAAELDLFSSTISGAGYSAGAPGVEFEATAVVAAPVPLPSSAAMLALAAGGLGLRAAAKRRRAARRTASAA